MAWFVYRSPAMKTLAELSREIAATLRGDGTVVVRGIAHDSRAVRAGDLFVAVRGQHTDTGVHVQEALQRGATAVCAERGSAHSMPGVPLLEVENARAALAQLSAIVCGNPARSLRLIGITGTLGKTSTAAFVQAALARSVPERRVGVIGSLGVGIERAAETGTQTVMELDGMTTPDAPALHLALRRLLDQDVRVVVMEVTSHALAQERVRGIGFELGVFTNLVPDEHLDFHGSPEEYLAVKARFLEHLLPGAPLVYNADDALVLDMVRSWAAAGDRYPVGVATGAGGSRDDAPVSIEDVRWHERGSDLTLAIRRPLRGASGTSVKPARVPVSLSLLGVQHAMNAALAATAALLAGASTGNVAASLERATPTRRRMEVVRSAHPRIIDDTTGNPESLRAVFQTIQPIGRSGLAILFGLRGSRGAAINRALAETLAELVLQRAAHENVRLVVTCGDDVADDRNRVVQAERLAALQVLESRLPGGRPGVEYAVEPTLTGAVQRLVQGIAGDELVLLLGTQGMDRAAELVERGLGAREPGRE